MYDEIYIMQRSKKKNDHFFSVEYREQYASISSYSAEIFTVTILI